MILMDKFPKQGLLLVISGPSGAGKGTICQELLKDENIKYSISATTRAPRGSEENGKEYFFLTTEEFETKIAADGFWSGPRFTTAIMGRRGILWRASLPKGRTVFWK